MISAAYEHFKEAGRLLDEADPADHAATKAAAEKSRAEFDKFLSAFGFPVALGEEAEESP